MVWRRTDLSSTSHSLTLPAASSLTCLSFLFLIFQAVVTHHIAQQRGQGPRECSSTRSPLRQPQALLRQQTLPLQL